MMQMETFMQTILQISISTAAVIGFLLLLVPIWQQRYSARWRKVIWLVIGIRLLVPFSLELSEAPVVMDVNLEEQTGFIIPAQEAAHTETSYDTTAVTENQAVTVKPEVQNYEETTMEPTVPVMVQKQEQEQVSYGTILFAVWILGFAVFVLWHCVQYAMFCRKVFATAMLLEDDGWLLKNDGEDMKVHRLPDIFISAEVQSPMLVGFIKPAILIPERIYEEQELLLILRHELMHYKHHDLWYKLILLVANAVHWFNPLVYLMLRQAGRDVEQVCDGNVVIGKDMAYRKAYSLTILNTMTSQKGVALSTCLSKDAQNVKKRFAGILQPKQYKRGAAVFLGIVLLAVAASGCLQIGEKDAGVEAYEKVAAFLPEDAIHDPTVYEVIGEADDEYLMYIWIEGAYEVTSEEAKKARLNEAALAYGRDGKDYLYDRALVMWVSQKDGYIASVGYDNRIMDNVKPSEIGRDKEKRDKYVQKIAKTLINDGENLAFKEQNVASNTDGNAIRGTYTTGTMADIEIYTMRLNYQHGYLEQFMYYGSDAWTQGRVSREYDITVEGMTETVELTMNRRPDYYVLFTDAESFNSQTGGEMIEGCFTDKYVLAGDDETTPVKTYMAVSYTPDCTMEEWRQTEKTGKTYAYTLPQIQ
ncbi:MAG: M56 family metallopeptidase, partial [Peptococcaceae bacterium]|nr:M56 family metallopeptidase [Peptococcaceae bacterium]